MTIAADHGHPALPGPLLRRGSRELMPLSRIHAGRQPQGVFKVVEWLFGKQIKAQAESDFDALKLLLEAG